jgi:glycosyltransferase involved in cell wall biosynthesis
MPGRRILIVCYPFPPVPSVGGNRWSSFARHLRNLGHEVVVITTGAYGRHADDGGWVVRTGDLNAASWLRRSLGRPPLSAPTQDPDSAIEKPAPALLTHVLVPDAFLLSWLPAALRAARRLVSKRQFDCLVTSSPFESTHLVGLALGRLRPPWLVDLRDGWTFEPLRPRFPTQAQRALDCAMERRVIKAASAVVAATHPIAADVTDRIGVVAETIVTGWDPALDAAVEAAAPPPLSSSHINIVHTGSLSGPWGRDPLPLFDALVRLREHEPRTFVRLRLVMAGRYSPAVAQAVADRGLEGAVRHVGHLSRADAAGLQRAANVLLLITSQHASEATGKLWEYLVAGPPILALAERNAAAEIVQDTGTGITVPPRDVEAIAVALQRCANGTLSATVGRRRLDGYVQPAPALRMAAAVERAISAQAPR